MYLYKLPQEVDFIDVLKHLVNHYRNATKIQQIQYLFWKYTCECLDEGGRRCPSFDTFLRYLKETHLLEAINQKLINISDIGTKQDCFNLIREHYRKPHHINNVIYVNFNKHIDN